MSVCSSQQTLAVLHARTHARTYLYLQSGTGWTWERQVLLKRKSGRDTLPVVHHGPYQYHPEGVGFLSHL